MSGVYESKKVSSRKGNNRKQGQTYKNTFAFHANKGSRITKQIAAMPIGGLCSKCVDVIEWRKKFRKYKPLTTARKCVNCDQKAIKEAYHVMCNNCAGEKNVCAKCLESREIVPTNIKSQKELVKEQVEFDRLLSGMNERQRRAYLRKLERKRKESAEEGAEENLEEEVEALRKHVEAMGTRSDSDFDDDSDFDSEEDDDKEGEDDEEDDDEEDDDDEDDEGESDK
ncbi:hypothetical protein DFQ27_004125 [Actinomortierella ambigua]|uniref:Uncharacterized protein n=1 Tax=Actinomortierella ambigua TaxID=1343610 RepID=A0A9P6Q4P5_9FUNG|nr:hypothetical protein DFQ27_004125 [Actinomortierella ambigua]